MTTPFPRTLSMAGLLAGTLTSLVVGWAGVGDRGLTQTPTNSEVPITVPPQKTSDAPLVEPQIDPQTPTPAQPFVKPLSLGQYVLEFNRSPIVGQRLRLQGIYDEARIQFTRPRNWQAKDAKLLLRFRHSPALYATRSNLTVLVNGMSVGSVPLNRKQGELANAVYPVPARILQDYNEVVIAALQNNSPTCTQDPFDPSLWTEVLPDSKLVFNIQPQPIALDFSRYPYPLFDTLSLEPNRIVYQLPQQLDETWLTATARLHAALGRLAQYRALETRVLKPIGDDAPSEAEEGRLASALEAGESDTGSDAISQADGDAASFGTLQPTERLVMIGTPSSQPRFADLSLPTPLKAGKWVDRQQKPLPDDVGVLLLTTANNGNNLVLVASGNGAAGVAKAVQFLVQSRDRQMGTGQVILVNQLESVAAPLARDWPAFLPTSNRFQLKDLKDYNSQPLGDITVRGADAPAVEVDLKALPDDRFYDGSTLNLLFSYSAQVNTLTSMVEVQLDGVPIAAKRLDSNNGALRQSLSVPLPADRIKPYSKLQVRFQLDPRERRSCNRATDQQLWGTVHADSQFDLKRSQSAPMPNLQLLQYGFPFAAPQDLSNTAIALPDRPAQSDVLLLLEMVERLGRLSRAESVNLEVYRAKSLPETAKQTHNLIGIGRQADFPIPQAFQTEGFVLQDLFGRKRDRSEIATLPDDQGVIKQLVSPWNPQRVILALSGQTDQGLDQLRDLFSRDDLFFQLREDTALIKANLYNPSPYDPQAYTLEFLSRARQTRDVATLSWHQQAFNTLRDSWFLLIPGTLVAALLLYSVFQTYLKRVGRSDDEAISAPSDAGSSFDAVTEVRREVVKKK
jgi:cellulose synthase operon protein B